MSNEKPPLGVEPAFIVAWKRIGELTKAIKRQYEGTNRNAKLCKAWAEEIKLQCEIIETIGLEAYF